VFMDHVKIWLHFGKIIPKKSSVIYVFMDHVEIWLYFGIIY
jgi:hypothetical protein